MAGLAAAAALASAGAQVTVLERRPQLGGRVYSYVHPALGEEVDSQHVVLGCCTNLMDLVEGQGIRWYDELTFLEPNGNRSMMRPGALPAPMHQTWSFLTAPMLSLRDKAGIARGLMQFLRGYPANDDEGFDRWLRRARQTERAIRHFWQPVVVSALNDSFERCSTKYAGKVFHETFLKSAAGGRLGIPVAPLAEFLAPVVGRLRLAGVRLEAKDGVEELRQIEGGRWAVRTGEDWTETDALVLAMNFAETRALLEKSGLPGLVTGDFLSSPITTIQLWFDRQVSELDHAVLLDTRVEWMFHKSRIRGWDAARGSYLELTISTSFAELKLGREEILAAALGEAEMFFPAMRHAQLLKWAVLKEARATFSVVPGLDRVRPAQATGVPGLFLAGDWTRTEWPSTMEGAVRSGRLAAGAVCGQPGRFLAAELPPAGLMRLLSRRRADAAPEPQKTDADQHK